jgi:hypothetical protein
MVPDFSRGVAKGAIEPGLYRQSKSEADTQFLSIVPRRDTSSLEAPHKSAGLFSTCPSGTNPFHRRRATVVSLPLFRCPYILVW